MIYIVTIHSRFRMANTRAVPVGKHMLSILNQDCEAVTPPHEQPQLRKELDGNLDRGDGANVGGVLLYMENDPEPFRERCFFMIRRIFRKALLPVNLSAIVLCLLFSGCSAARPDNGAPAAEAPAAGTPAAQTPSSVEIQTEPRPDSAPAGSPDSLPDAPQSSVSAESGTHTIDQDAAFALALENAGVPEADAFNRKVEQDEESGIPVFQVEFETEYGDYDFEIAISDGRIVGADYEVDEEWLDVLGGSPVTPEEAQAAVQAKVPGSDAADVSIRQEQEDGRGRYEGELFYDGMKYEFEIDPPTGIIYDWNADLRE